MCNHLYVSSFKIFILSFKISVFAFMKIVLGRRYLEMIAPSVLTYTAHTTRSFIVDNIFTYYEKDNFVVEVTIEKQV